MSVEGCTGMPEERKRRMLPCPPARFHKERAVFAGWRFCASKFRDEKEQVIVVRAVRLEESGSAPRQQ
jgi:hypothetical protein